MPVGMASFEAPAHSGSSRSAQIAWAPGRMAAAASCCANAPRARLCIDRCRHQREGKYARNRRQPRGCATSPIASIPSWWQTPLPRARGATLSPRPGRAWRWLSGRRFLPVETWAYCQPFIENGARQLCSEARGSAGARREATAPQAPRHTPWPVGIAGLTFVATGPQPDQPLRWFTAGCARAGPRTSLRRGRRWQARRGRSRLSWQSEPMR